jgi:hypothetical protein
MPESADTPVVRRSEEFASLYANNVQYESSVWDLKMVLGELDQSVTPNAVEQHTAVILPWQQAKLAAYFLIVNTMIYEATNGKMPFPSRIIPQRPDPTDPDLDDTGKKVIKYLAWVHDQFFGPNPYIPPSVAAEVAQPSMPDPTTP